MTHICEHQGCYQPGEPVYIYVDLEPKPDHHYCYDHMGEHGFCYGCHLFHGGLESFHFSGITGLCADCEDDLRAETGEYDDDEQYHY